MAVAKGTWIDGISELAALLGLSRPLVFLDIESTAPHELARPKPEADQIVQFGALKLLPDGECRTFVTLVRPLVPVTAASTKVHGITAEMVAGARLWGDVGPGIIEGLHGCDIAGYSARQYDLPLLRAECERHRIHGPQPDEQFRCIDVYKIAAQKERRDLTWAYRFYTGKELDGGHRADVDVRATAEALAGQLRMYADLPRTVEALQDFCFPVDPTWLDKEGKFQWRDGEVVLNFGPNEGATIQSIDHGFLRWMLRHTFAADAKKIASDALRGVFPVPPADMLPGAGQ